MIPQGSVDRSGRVVIGLTAMSNNEGAISTGVSIAAVFGSDVMGLFIEEDALHDLAGLPFAIAQTTGLSQPEKITSDAMVRALARQAAMCREALEKHARRSRLEWTFSVRRGAWAVAYKDVHAPEDVLVLAREPRGEDLAQLVERLRIAQTFAKSIVIGATRPAAGSDAPVVAIVDEGEVMRGPLTLAARWASRKAVPFHVLTIASGEEGAQAITKEVRAVVGPDQNIIFHHLAPDSRRDVIAVLSGLRPALTFAALQGSVFGDDAASRDVFRAVKSAFLLTQASDY